MKLAYQLERTTNQTRANWKCETPYEISVQWELQRAAEQSCRMLSLDFYSRLRRLANRRGIRCIRQGERIYLEQGRRRYCIRYAMGRIELWSERRNAICKRKYHRECTGWMTPEQVLEWLQGERDDRLMGPRRYKIHVCDIGKCAKG